MMRFFTIAAFFPTVVLGCECPGGYPTCGIDGWCSLEEDYDSTSSNCGASFGAACTSSYSGPMPPPPPPAFLSDLKTLATNCDIDYEWHGCSAKCTFGLEAQTAGLHAEFVLHIDVQSDTEGEVSLSFGKAEVLGENVGLDGTEILGVQITGGVDEEEFDLPGLSFEYGVGIATCKAGFSMMTRFTVAQSIRGLHLDNTMIGEFGYKFATECGGYTIAEVSLHPDGYGPPVEFQYRCVYTTGVAVVVVVAGLVLIGGGYFKKKKGSNSASDPPAFEMRTAPADSSEAKV